MTPKSARFTPHLDSASIDLHMYLLRVCTHSRNTPDTLPRPYLYVSCIARPPSCFPFRSPLDCSNTFPSANGPHPTMCPNMFSFPVGSPRAADPFRMITCVKESTFTLECAACQLTAGIDTEI